MTATTIKLESDCPVLGVFLHHPDEASPDPLAGVSHSVKLDLNPGPYAVSVSGTQCKDDANVKITITTSKNSKTDTQIPSSNGDMIGWFPFLINSDGSVS